MAKPYIIESFTKKYSEPRIFRHPVAFIKNHIMKDLNRPGVLFYGGSKAIDERDMRFWKEFAYSGKFIGVMRRWKNGRR